MAISPFGIIVLVLLAFAVIKGLAGPHTRPFVLGLLIFGVVGFFFAFSARKKEAQREAWSVHDKSKTGPQESVEVTPHESSIADPSHAAPLRRGEHRRINVLEGLLQALGKTLDSRQHSMSKPIPSKETSVVAVELAKTSDSREPPAWVREAPSSRGGVDFMSIEVGPWETETECNRDLPKALQAAVADYAQRMLPLDAARQVRLPDDVLNDLIRERWPQHLTKEFGGVSKDMILLHVLVGFDLAMQQRIRGAAEGAIVTQRLQGAGVVLGGVLGLLALLWGSLRMAGK